MLRYVRNAEELIARLSDKDAKCLLDILKIENEVAHNPQSLIIEIYNEMNREVIDNFIMNIYDESEIEYTRHAYGHYHNKELPYQLDFLGQYFDRKRYNYRITLENGEMIIQKSHYKKFFDEFLYQCEWAASQKTVNCWFSGIEYVLLTNSEVIQISSALYRAEIFKTFRTQLTSSCKNT